MTLSDIAAGLEVTTQQRDRGAAVVDDTDVDLRDRIAGYADELPCTPAATATLVDSYKAGTSVGDAARETNVAPITAAKTLHRCGVDGICPLTPSRREVVRDWLNGRLPRSEAIELAGGDEADFALATYIETHEPITELADAVARGASNLHSTFDDGLGGSLETPDDLR